jgi:hypothetical protein
LEISGDLGRITTRTGAHRARRPHHSTDPDRIPTLVNAMRSLIIAIAAAWIVLPATAAATPYSIYQCSDSAGNPAELTPGFFSAFVAGPNDRCAARSPLEANLGNGNVLAPYGSEWQAAGVQFSVPAELPNTRITRAYAKLSVAPKKDGGANSYGHFAINTESGSLYMAGIPQGDWAGFTDAGQGADVPGGARTVQFLIQCYGPCAFQAYPTMALRQAILTLDESTLPAAPKPEPVGLLDGTPQSGTRALRFAASDGDSGVQRVELHTSDGTLIGSTGAGAGCSYTRPAPCPQSRPQEEIAVDTSELAAGAQALELWTVDAAGNVRKTALPSITVAAPTGPGPAPARTKAKVAFKVSSAKPRRGAKVTLSGTVTPVPANKSRVMIETRGKKGKWITAAVVSLRAGGKYSWSHRFGTRGTYKMRARLLGTGDKLVKPGFSSTRTFRVR